MLTGIRHTAVLVLGCKLKGEKVNNGWLISKKEMESFASTYEETRGRPANGRAQRNGAGSG